MQSVTIRELEFRRRAGAARRRANGDGGARDFALGPLTLRLGAGSRTALVGPSGCGKTTLLRCIAGLERPTAGMIWIGERLASNAAGIQVEPGERRIGFVFQQAALWPHMTALEHLRFVAPALSRDQAQARLARVGLGGFEKRRPAELSGGEVQRLPLARALAGDPDILLLDEPLGSIDVHLRDELALLVRSVAEDFDLTLIVVTHDRDEALAMAEHLVVLRDGGIVEAGSASQLLREPRTAFTARFLGRAVCLPIEATEAGFATVFGPVEVPEHAAAEDCVLAVLPHDVVVTPSPSGEADSREARVLNVRDDGFGNRTALVEIAGQTLSVPCGAATVPGGEVALRLRGAPRVLPRHGPFEEAS